MHLHELTHARLFWREWGKTDGRRALTKYSSRNLGFSSFLSKVYHEMCFSGSLSTLSLEKHSESYLSKLLKTKKWRLVVMNRTMLAFLGDQKSTASLLFRSMVGSPHLPRWKELLSGGGSWKFFSSRIPHLKWDSDNNVEETLLCWPSFDPHKT